MSASTAGLISSLNVDVCDLVRKIVEHANE